MMVAGTYRHKMLYTFYVQHIIYIYKPKTTSSKNVVKKIALKIKNYI